MLTNFGTFQGLGRLTAMSTRPAHSQYFRRLTILSTDDNTSTIITGLVCGVLIHEAQGIICSKLDHRSIMEKDEDNLTACGDGISKFEVEWKMITDDKIRTHVTQGGAGG